MQSAWNDEHTNILTTIAITPERWIKGESSANPFILRVPGGTVGDITEITEDMPSFQEGERVVLLLVEPQGGYEVTGGVLGKTIVNDDEELLNDLIQRIQTILASSGQEGALEEETPEAVEPLSNAATIEPPSDMLTVEPFPGTATIEPPPATATVDPLLDATPLAPDGGLATMEAPEPGFYFLFLPVTFIPSTAQQALPTPPAP
jgi:hypothetical protein